MIIPGGPYGSGTISLNKSLQTWKILSSLNALIKCNIDCPSMCNWPINVQCPQCLPQRMLYEIGFDLIKWKIEGLLSRSMYFLCQINVFESLNPKSEARPTIWSQALCPHAKQSASKKYMLTYHARDRNWPKCNIISIHTLPNICVNMIFKGWYIFLQ